MQTPMVIFLTIVLSCTGPSETLSQYAEVLRVEVSGDEQIYSFSVTLKSPDTGCEQFADWWEVLSTEGVLIYRRILLHSHVNEQPFTRDGGPIEITKNNEVIVRAHMNTAGYGTDAMQGSVSGGFKKVTLSRDFATSLEKEEPLPTGCAF
jgi:hypothetical protein